MADPIVGHKTFSTPDGGFRHEPLRESEAAAIMKSVDEAKARRAALMPTEQDAARENVVDRWRLPINPLPVQAAARPSNSGEPAMTEDLIATGREAGFCITDSLETIVGNKTALEAYTALVVARTREECAKVTEEAICSCCWPEGFDDAAAEIAAAIRALGERT